MKMKKTLAVLLSLCLVLGVAAPISVYAEEPKKDETVYVIADSEGNASTVPVSYTHLTLPTKA